MLKKQESLKNVSSPKLPHSQENPECTTNVYGKSRGLDIIVRRSTEKHLNLNKLREQTYTK